MNTSRFLSALTLVNLLLLIVGMTQVRPTLAQGTVPVIRARALEIVDEREQVRARINIEPSVKMADGQTYPEAVVFRMTDPNGLIRVKLGADQDGSGLVLADGSQQPGVHALAKSTGSFLKVVDRNGREQLVKP
jgi:hypothetical protein